MTTKLHFISTKDKIEEISVHETSWDQFPINNSTLILRESSNMNFFFVTHIYCITFFSDHISMMSDKNSYVKCCEIFSLEDSGKKLIETQKIVDFLKKEKGTTND